MLSFLPKESAFMAHWAATLSAARDEDDQHIPTPAEIDEMTEGDWFEEEVRERMEWSDIAFRIAATENRIASLIGLKIKDPEKNIELTRPDYEMSLRERIASRKKRAERARKAMMKRSAANGKTATTVQDFYSMFAPFAGVNKPEQSGE